MPGSDQLRGYDRGIALLGDYFMSFDNATLAKATDTLRQAAADADEVESWVALGYCLDLVDDRDGALAALQKAAALAPDNIEVEVYILTLLAESGKEAEAMAGVRAAAARLDVDLDFIERELKAAEMRTDAINLIQNGFLHARNYTRSGIEDDIDSRNRRKSRAKLQDAMQHELERLQQELQANMDTTNVPVDILALQSWAERLGIGDDEYREMAITQLTAAERHEAIIAVNAEAIRINDWLDTVGEQPMTDTQAAYMYLLLAIEEMG